MGWLMPLTGIKVITALSPSFYTVGSKEKYRLE
jgi:hypothetical protein